MDSEIVDVVTDWGSRSFSGGYDGLRELADEEFTGAVTEGSAWLFFLNGRIVGVFDGSLEDFETAGGTAYDAPDPSLPMLYTMVETGGQTKAQYYTEDTPMQSADQTLSSGSFTGYVELSENVLSGDYYVVYYGGRKLPCAFVGQSRDLLTGEEAFERAADEVGIYEVKDVDIDIVELPEPDDGADTEPSGTEESGPDSTASAGTDGEESDVSVSMNGGGETGRGATGAADPSGAGDTGAGRAREQSAATADTEAATGGETATGTEATASTETAADTATASDPATESRTSATSDTGPETTSGGATAGAGADTSPRATPESGTEPAVTRTADESDRPNRADDAAADESAADGEDPDLASEKQWRNTRTIPSLDPDRSSTDGQPTESHDESSTGSESSGGRSSVGGRSSSRSKSSSGGQSASNGRSEKARSSGGSSASSRGQQSGGGSGRTAGGSSSVSDATVQKLHERVQTLESAREEARQELEDARSRLESKTEETESLRSENERLESRVSELESEIDDLQAQLDEVEAYVPDGDHEISPEDALSGTNLFVRYESKGNEQLEDAHAETATRAEVEENLRIETHTEFEKDGAVVDGQSYDDYLAESLEYRFVRWVVEELLYEIQQTGTEAKLKDLYDVIPEIDRAEIHGSVDIYDEEAGVEMERPFDVILRDRMGNPVVVTNVTDSRDSTRGPAVQELIDDARDVAEIEDTLGCAFYVTASFFEPGALEAITEETGGGFLSRSKRASYLKLARKQGFHLSLVESNDDGFHITVPEL